MTSINLSQSMMLWEILRAYLSRYFVRSRKIKCLLVLKRVGHVLIFEPWRLMFLHNFITSRVFIFVCNLRYSPFDRLGKLERSVAMTSRGGGGQGHLTQAA